MSITLLSLAVTVVCEGAKILKDSGVNLNGIAKMSKPAIRELSREVDKHVDEYVEQYNTDGWITDAKFGSTVLHRTYILPSGKTLEGVEDSIYQYFNTLHNVSVSKTFADNGARIVKCKANIPRKAAGLKLDLEVRLIQNEENILVSYESPTNEIIEAVKGIGLSFFVLGSVKLLGIHIRHEIPISINRVISEYLNDQELLNLEKCTETVKQYILLAEQGDSGAQRELGRCYANGEGVGRNDKKAVEYYLKAANQGNIEAQEQLCRCYSIGAGVERNLVEAEKWEKMARRQK